MPLPAGVTTVPFHGQIASNTGAAGKGTVSFYMPFPLRDTVNNGVVGNNQPLTVTLDVNGEFTVSLPATDDADITPTGWAYTIHINTDVWQDRFQFQVPAATVGTLELSDVVAVVVPPTAALYALKDHTHTPASIGAVALGDPLTPMITSGAAFRINGRGSAYAIGFDQIAGLGYFATTGLFTSTDNIALTTRTLPTGVPSGADLGKVVRYGAHVYCIAKDSSGFVKVFRSLPPGADLAWSQVHATVATGALGPALSASDWGTSDYLYTCEYGDPVGGPSAYRSADGITWETVIGPIAGLRHFHAIAADPYRPGHVYLNGGDGQSKVLWRSTNYGAPGSWTQIITDNTFQSVQISFSEDWVYCAGDTGLVSVYVIDRDNPTRPMIASANYHGLTPVPGGLAGRGVFTDAVLTGGSPTLSSATAAFTPSDVGKMVRFANVFANIDQAGGVWISAYQSATAVTLNKPAIGSQTGRQFFIDGDSYYRNAFFGVVDPATGVYYCVSNDSSSGGTRSGLFALTHVGGRLELLESYPTQTPGELFLWNGSLWCHQARHPLLTVA